MSKDPNIIYVGDVKPNIPQGGLGKALFDKLKENGDAIAQIDTVTGEEDTFSELLKRILRTAIKMRQKGVKRGDIIAVCDYSHLNTCVPFFASLFVGAVATAADNNLTLPEMTYLVKKIDAKLIFVSSQTEELLAKAIKNAQVDTQIVVFDGSKCGNIHFEEFLEVNIHEEATFEPTLIEDLEAETAIILFSSGSTGQPKGVCLNHYSILFQMFDGVEITIDGYKVLQFSSFYWISKVYITFWSLFLKYSVLITPEFDEALAWELIAKYRVDSLVMSPVQAIKLFRSEHFENADCSSLKTVMLGGNKVTEQLMIEIKNKIPNSIVYQGWSMTELAGRSLMFNEKELTQISTDILNRSIGKPAKAVWYKIVDVETGKTLGPNQPGELRVKSKIQMNGYYKMDSSHVWDEDGYLKTGDMMYYDEDHYFYYVERIGEMFKYRSEYVYPNVVEDAFMTHPAVKVAVVVGLPHPEDGMHAAAMVTLKDPKSVITSEELQKYVEQKMHGRIPLLGGVMLVDAIPEASSGKTKKKIVREILAENRK